MKNNRLLLSELAFVLSVTLAVSLGLSLFAAPTLLGDVDVSGMITSTDARWALQAAVEKRVLTGTSLENADVNADSKVTTTDARKILGLSLQPLVLSSVSMNTSPSTSSCPSIAMA